MSFPKFLLLILFGILAATTVGTANIGTHNDGGVPQRLRVSVEKHRLSTDETTKVIVEFLDRDYNQVDNDATRVITLGRASSGARTNGSGKFNAATIVVKPGARSGEAFFTSTSAGRLYITASSEGLESGQALVLISSSASASLLERFVGLFETVAHAQDDVGFEITPKIRTATANGKHRANFNVSFFGSHAAETIVRITTNVTNGGILYKGQKVGDNIADIKLGEDEDISGEISVYSENNGRFDVSASVRPDGPTDKANVEFTQPLPAQIIFDDDPTTIGTDPTGIPLTVRIADVSGFAIKPDREHHVRFECATEGDRVTFDRESVVLSPGQPSAQVVFRLQQLPLGNELKLLATTDGISAGRKNLIIKSAIEKILIDGSEQVDKGNEREYTVYLVDKSGKRFAADWDRQIDLNVNGGALSTTQLVIPRGARKATFKYTPSDAGTYVLKASSGGIDEATHSVRVVHPVYLLAMFAVFGGALGGVARELDRHKAMRRILPRRHHKRFDTRFAARLGCSLIGALFLYLLYKLGLAPILGGPSLPVALDPELRLVAFFLGGIGGFAGTLVLTLITKFFVPPPPRHQPAPAQ